MVVTNSTYSNVARQLAEKAGLTPLTVGFIEQGRRWPRIVTLHKLAKSLNVSADELLKGLKS